ncbi:MAG: acylneuraminate cytidylyltransferase family protein [Muribaculaceae bacterium]|nr:acylneuraminate cytidylyltransferase family protein [Muribaculaceae bacterium]
MNNILVTICARGGSKGIPGKNIKEVGGLPLIAYTISAAKAYAGTCGADIVLSTDSDQIRQVAALHGLESDYVRPEFLANDTCGKPDAIRHAMLWAESHYSRRYDIVVDLDVTSPIRTLRDICECVSMLEADPNALTIFSVNPAARNPYFNMVEEKPSGYCGVVLGGLYTTRQSAPKVYDMNASIYAYRREALMAEPPRAVTDRSLAYVMDHICFDLDEPTDYDYLAYLIDTGRVTIP